MSTRLGVVLGLLLAVAIGTWWLTASRIAIEQSADPAALAAQTILVLAITRAALILLVGARASATAGFSAGVRAAIAVAVVAWPLVMLVWVASSTRAIHALGIELALLATGLLASGLGGAARRVLQAAVSR